ncbi:MAG: FkbM family methyltransferase [Candidatus Helarchaeota archaeon]
MNSTPLRLLKRSIKSGFVKAITTLLMGIILYFFSLSNLKKRVTYFIQKKFCRNVVRTINGSKMLLSFKGRGIHRDLLLYSKREAFATNYLKTSGIIKKGDAVLDIGANIGYFVLLESKIVGKSGKVYAIEPVSKNVNYLKKNVELNKRKNIEIYHMAVGEKVGKTKIYVSDRSNLSSLQKNLNFNYIGEEIIELTTIDSFLKGKRIPKLIRMDVEGYEYNIFKGMKETLKNDVDLFIEVHPTCMTGEQLKEFIDILEQNNYYAIFALMNYYKHSFNKFADAIIYKMLGTPLLQYNLNMKQLHKLLIAKYTTAHVFFSKHI